MTSGNSGPHSWSRYYRGPDGETVSYVLCDSVADEADRWIGSPPEFSGWLNPPDPDVDDLMSKAFKDMKPQVEQLVQGLVSLIEFKDIGSTITSARKLSSFLDRFAKGRLAPKERTFKGLAKLASDSTLAYQFGVKPLMNDIVGVYSSFLNYQNQFRKLWDNQGKTMTAHWRAPSDLVPVSDSRETEHVNETSGWARETAVLASEYKKNMFNVTMRYTYELVNGYTGQSLTREEAYRLGRLDQLGINLDPSYVWELVPYSFVVDWFVDIGGWLHQFAKNGVDSRIRVQDLCYSRKFEQAITLDMRAKALSGWSTLQRSWQKSRLERKYYFRDRVYPKAEWIHGSDGLNLSLPSWKQWALSALLAIQRL
jgi:hypothetical protein